MIIMQYSLIRRYDQTSRKISRDVMARALGIDSYSPRRCNSNIKSGITEHK